MLSFVEGRGSWGIIAFHSLDLFTYAYNTFFIIGLVKRGLLSWGKMLGLGFDLRKVIALADLFFLLFFFLKG